MNRYPLWKYATLLVALLIGAGFVSRVQQLLDSEGLQPDLVQFDGNSVRARLPDTDAQMKARDALDKALNPDPSDPRYIVALNLVSRSPTWLTSIHALPMYLGLDLRGGVHFLMQVDMKAALTKKAESTAGDMRSLMRDKNIRHAGIARERDDVVIRFSDEATLKQALPLLTDQFPDLQWTAGSNGGEFKLTGSLTAKAARAVQEAALKQNITTLHNRINELGVCEPDRKSTR